MDMELIKTYQLIVATGIFKNLESYIKVREFAHRRELSDCLKPTGADELNELKANVKLMEASWTNILEPSKNETSDSRAL